MPSSRSSDGSNIVHAQDCFLIRYWSSAILILMKSMECGSVNAKCRISVPGNTANTLRTDRNSKSRDLKNCPAPKMSHLSIKHYFAADKTNTDMCKLKKQKQLAPTHGRREAPQLEGAGRKHLDWSELEPQHTVNCELDVSRVLDITHTSPRNVGC